MASAATPTVPHAQSLDPMRRRSRSWRATFVPITVRSAATTRIPPVAWSIEPEVGITRRHTASWPLMKACTSSGCRSVGTPEEAHVDRPQQDDGRRCHHRPRLDEVLAVHASSRSR